jgi:hypothetical protein
MPGHALKKNLKSPLVITVQGDRGLTRGEVATLDAQHLVFQCSERFDVGTDLIGRLELRRDDEPLVIHLRIDALPFSRGMPRKDRFVMEASYLVNSLKDRARLDRWLSDHVEAELARPPEPPLGAGVKRQTAVTSPTAPARGAVAPAPTVPAPPVSKRGPDSISRTSAAPRRQSEAPGERTVSPDLEPLPYSVERTDPVIPRMGPPLPGTVLPPPPAPPVHMNVDDLPAPEVTPGKYPMAFVRFQDVPSMARCLDLRPDSIAWTLVDPGGLEAGAEILFVVSLPNNVFQQSNGVVEAAGAGRITILVEGGASTDRALLETLLDELRWK